MNRLVVKAKVSSDGSLHLNLPVGTEKAGQEVQITVEPVPPTPMTQAEWQDWVASMAGTWQGDFERMPQGEYEEREPLS